VDWDHRLIDWANETRAKINKLQKHSYGPTADKRSLLVTGGENAVVPLVW
jgi:hypothetical protein